MGEPKLVKCTSSPSQYAISGDKPVLDVTVLGLVGGAPGGEHPRVDKPVP